jgi:hypothetical protein
VKLWEVFRFEVAYQLRRPLTWVLFAGLFAFLLAVTTSMFATSARGGGYTINGPFVTALGTLLGSAVALLGLAAFAGDAAARDAQTMMHPLVYTSPVAKATYLGGRFLGAFALGALLLAAIPLAMLLAAHMPGVDPSLVGPFRPGAYLGAYVTIALGNALAASAIFFAMAALSRRAVAGYLGDVLLFVTAFVCSRILGEELGYWELGKIFDPLGLSVLTALWTTTTPVQKEALSVGLYPPLLLNRAVWLGVAACALALTYLRFRFAHAGTGGGRTAGGRAAGGRAAAHGDRAESPAPEASAPIVAPRVARSFGGTTRARQTIAVATHSFRDVATSWGGLVLGVMAALLVLIGPHTMDHIGVPLLPTTVQMLALAANTGEILWAIVPMVAGFYVGELVWRDRETRLSEISDAAPVPEWVRFLGRFLGVALVVVAYQALLMAACMLVQVQLGYYDFQLGLYAKVFFGVLLVDHLLFVAMAFAVHVLVNQKYVGHIVALALFALSAFATALGVEHRLVPFAAAPDWSYTEMRGFGESLAPWAWFKLYWGAWALLLAVLGTLFWVRGKELGLASRLASARERLTRATAAVGAAAVALVVATGGFVFYNTNVLNAYATGPEKAERSAEYERRYGQYDGIPQPRLAGTSLRVEIYPERREAEIHATYRLVNASDAAIDAIHLAPAPSVATGPANFDRPAELVLDDAWLGHRVYRLETALQPGESMRLDVGVRFAPRGFTNDGIDQAVAANGTFIDADGWLPAIGYQKNRELDGEGERAAYGLPPRPPIPPLEDAARADVGAALDYDFEAVVGTADGQVAVAPGALRETWTENDRSYFHYVADAPIDDDVDIFSAAYAVREARWNDVAIEIFHHPAHAANVDRMVASVQASLDSYTRHFGPYPRRQIRLVERPSNGFSLHAGPGNISYEEGFSFFDPGSDPRGLDFVFAVVAHEVAHQWWAGQLRPAYVEGAPVLSESLAWYSAMGVMEEAHGPEHLGRLLETMREAYVNPRARAGVPLLRSRDWFTSYRKGPFAMYALREYVGAERVDTALRRLLERNGSSEAPAQTSLDLYAELRAVAPESLHPLLADLFEANTYWELETKRVTARPTDSGAWEVTLDVKARKVVVDEEGVETEAPMDDMVEIGVFAAGEANAPGDSSGEPLYLEMRRVHAGEQRIVVTVAREPGAAGIDPRHLLIDVLPGDNLAEATREAVAQ